MNLIDKTLDRATLCYGANPMPWDRLFKGNVEQADFFTTLARERKEMLAALDTAALLIAERDAELSDMKAVVKANGVANMELGARRDET